MTFTTTLVLKERLELSRDFSHWYLKPVCLPFQHPSLFLVLDPALFSTTPPPRARAPAEGTGFSLAALVMSDITRQYIDLVSTFGARDLHNLRWGSMVAKMLRSWFYF